MENENLNSGLVFSIYYHDFFKYLIGAYSLPFLADGSYSLSNSRNITLENLSEFKDMLTEEERQLVLMCNEIHPKNMIRQFKGDPFHPFAFFEEILSPKNQKQYELILTYIEKRLIKILPLLEGKAVYEMANDGYPAHKPVNMLKEKASITFHFHREPQKLLYYITIRLKEKNTILTNQRAKILTNFPAWILRQGELFTFGEEIEGKKMQPFLTKMNIEVPKEREEEYFRKFVTQIMEKYEVRHKGFSVRVIERQPEFHLYINSNHPEYLGFEKKVSYGDYSFTLTTDQAPKTKMNAFFEKEGPEFIIYKIFRNVKKEKQAVELLSQMIPDKESFLAWENIARNKALSWMADNIPVLKEVGFRIHFPENTAGFSFEKPAIEMSSVKRGDWFDIQAVVVIGEYRIPFIRFRNHILKNQREYLLPDGSVAILPETWFSQYHFLVKLGKETDNGLEIKKRDYSLIQAQMETEEQTFVNTVFQPLPYTAYETPAGINAVFRTYQKEGYEWLINMQDRDRGVILADDMGLGKTLQTLAVLQHEKEKGVKTPSLVVMPTSLVFNWLKEAAKFTPDLRVTVHTGPSRTKNAQSFAFFDLVLSTYGTVRMDIDMLKEFEFHYIILDESQSIKNPDSKISKAVKQLSSQFKLSLTGTPVENSVLDIWSQMKFLNPELFDKLYGTEQQFQKNYVIPIEKNQNPEKLTELKKVIRHFVKRRKKEQVAGDLPPKVENIHYCEMTEKQEKEYNTVRDSYRNYLMDILMEGNLNKNKLNILAGLQKIRQLAIHPRLINPEMDIMESGKYEEVKRLLQEIIAEGSKVLIFSQFVGMLQIMKNDFVKEKIRFQYLDGSTPPKERQKAVEVFQNNPNESVFLISLKAGGTGLNLTAADYVFIIDPWWNPAVEMQAIDRAHRIGQEKTVFYYKFITQNSIEEKILKLQQTKFRLSEDLLSENEEFLSKLSEEDLKWILS